MYTEICEEDIRDIFEIAKLYYCDGIYVKSNAHPCGWDFISFEDFEISDDMFGQPISIFSISNGHYGYHDYEGKTVEEVIKEVGMQGLCFEVSGVDNF